MCENLKNFDSLDIKKIETKTIQNVWAECKNSTEFPKVDFSTVTDEEIDWSTFDIRSINPTIFGV